MFYLLPMDKQKLKVEMRINQKFLEKLKQILEALKVKAQTSSQSKRIAEGSQKLPACSCEHSISCRGV